MRFSWTGLILAPLLVPVIFSATFSILAEGDGDPLLAFLTMLVLGCIVSYGSTILLFLPCLFLLSLDYQMTGFKVCLLGLVLGAVEFVSLALIAWGSRGPDLPIKNFFVFFLLWAAGPVTALFPLAGLITAGLYWWLGKRRTGRSVPVE
ncbi:hypothetical protein SAMN05444159_2071 [Bradyrhizobium lablabi]|uniref:Uncharacterized protein n=2 Tax=Bradyrhizobium lablabi TaxID=722472 RepID=A0A1M6NQ63_9BRAD|nr:hypothetical protein SAMN05444159_2071 [Bradyrhizobium lablabi]